LFLNDVYLHHVTIDQHKKAIQAFLRSGKLICVGKYSSISKLETLSFSKLSPFSPTALECALYRCQFSPPPPRQQHSVLSMPLSRCFANECNYRGNNKRLLLWLKPRESLNVPLEKPWQQPWTGCQQDWCAIFAHKGQQSTQHAGIACPSCPVSPLMIKTSSIHQRIDSFKC